MIKAYIKIFSALLIIYGCVGCTKKANFPDNETTIQSEFLSNEQAYSYRNNQALLAELAGRDPGEFLNPGGGNNSGSGGNDSPVSTGSCGNSLACGMVDEINRLRRANGLRDLLLDEACSRAAQAHADDMMANNYFSHFGLNGSSPDDRAMAYGSDTPFISENIAQANADVPFVATLWMNSPGHRANILDRNMSHTGVGAAGSGNGVFWVQCFMGK